MLAEVIRTCKGIGYHQLSFKTWNKSRQMMFFLLTLGFNIFGIQYYSDMRDIAILWSLDFNNCNSVE